MTDAVHTRMSKEGRVLIPAELRNALGLQAEEPLKLYIVDGELRIVSRRQAIRRAQAILAKYKREGAAPPGSAPGPPCSCACARRAGC